MKSHIYADNAATTRLSDKALESMIPWLTGEYGNASQSYSFSRKPKQALQESRAIIAECIGATPEEIYFTSGGTESNNWVIKNATLNKPGNNGIVTSQIEHHAVLNACEFEKQYRGRRIQLLPVSKQAIIAPEELINAISPSDGLVSVMLANNEVGTIEPISILANIAHEHSALFHTDAVQAIGHIPVNVKELNVDFLSSSAHKFNGPKGIGFLYIKKGVNIPPYIAGGKQEMGSRAGTENVASIVGMAAALEENVQEMPVIQERLLHLETLFLSRLDTMDVTYVRNGAPSHIPGNMSISFSGLEGEAIMHRLDLMGISISTGSACDSKNTQISHVLKAMRLEESVAKGTVRISLGRYNTEEDVEAIAAAIRKIIS